MVRRRIRRGVGRPEALVWLALLLLLAGCAPAATTPLPSITPAPPVSSSTPGPSPTLRPTPTPRPTHTPLPSLTPWLNPTPEPTPFPLPVPSYAALPAPGWTFYRSATDSAVDLAFDHLGPFVLYKSRITSHLRKCGSHRKRWTSS